MVDDRARSEQKILEPRYFRQGPHTLVCLQPFTKYA